MLQDRFFVNSIIGSLIFHILALIVFSIITFQVPEISQAIPVSLVKLEGSVPSRQPRERPVDKNVPKESSPAEPKKTESVEAQTQPKAPDTPKVDEALKVKDPELPKAEAPKKVDLSSAVTLKREVATDLKKPLPSEIEKKEPVVAKKVDLQDQLQEKIEVEKTVPAPTVLEETPKAPATKKVEFPLADETEKESSPKPLEKTTEDEKIVAVSSPVSPPAAEDQIKEAKESITESVLKENDKITELKPPAAIVVENFAPDLEKESPAIDRPEGSEKVAQNIQSVPQENFEIKWSGVEREVLERFVPEYPEKAQREGIKPIITLRFWVKPNGEVDRVVLERAGGYRELDSLALEAMRSWKFNPLGRYQKQQIQQGSITMRFELVRR